MDRLAQLLNPRAAALTTATLAIFGLGGCTTSAPENAYAEDFAQARELATSDFEREALADDRITREEYEEAIQRYLSCMKDAGVTVNLEDNYGYYTYSVSQNATRYDEVTNQCSMGTTMLLEGLYIDVLTNPKKLHPDEATARCLVGVGLVEEPFGAEDFRRLEAAAGAQGAEITDGEVKPHTNSVPIDPKALEIVGHEHFQACTANQQFHRTLENENR